MKGLICYYSGSGNTKLACQYLAKKLSAVDWTFCNLVRDPLPDFSGFDAAGFACFTDFWGVPQRMAQMIQSLPRQDAKPAFMLTTFGMIGGQTLRDLGRLVRARGFKTIAGFALHTPENYPPLICRGMAMAQAPNPKEMKQFNAFVLHLGELLARHRQGGELKNRKPGESLFGYLFPTPKRTTARKDMGEKYVDQSLCTQCGICVQSCPYQAVRLDPFPRFDQEKCFGCWACFHHCPQQAIYTKKFRGRGHYPRPIPALVEKLS
jgi:ferredoxin/flavodoxin